MFCQKKILNKEAMLLSYWKALEVICHLQTSQLLLLWGMQLAEDAVWMHLLTFSEWNKSLLYVQPGQAHDALLSLRA